MDINFTSTIEASYLMEEEPFENLKIGNRFKLYEELELITQGKITMDK